jgi:UDP-glucose 4-epimerase
MFKKIFITGGAGFIGSNLVEFFLAQNKIVTVFDNLSNGKKKNLSEFIENKNFNFIKGDVKNFNFLKKVMKNHEIVIHLSSNADIAKAQLSPLIDFNEGISLTVNVLESMRENKIKNLIFTSGSGVYGEVPDYPVSENFSPLKPVSTYGAQKLSSENYMSSYSFMFDMCCIVFRFANVVGPKQTHGVTHDFLLKLTKNNKSLDILGDGTQTKPFIHINDINSAFNTIFNKLDFSKSFFEVYNIATDDHISVNKIADLICHELRLKSVKYKHTGGKRGWKSDVPKYSLDTNKIKKLGWKQKLNSQDAVKEAIKSMIIDINKGLYEKFI